jgi:hypothetical protein
VAFPVVLIGLVSGGIRRGELRYGQWQGAWWDGAGNQHAGVEGKQVPTIVALGVFKLWDIPDEPGVGLYERTLSKMYRSDADWFKTVLYQLGLRNMAQGVPYLWAVHGDDIPANRRFGKFLGITYGWRKYEDWRSYTDLEVRDANPSGRRYYYVPDIFLSAEDARR